MAPLPFKSLKPSLGKVILKGNQYYDKNNIRNAPPRFV